MRITESKLRSIIRSVIAEGSMHDIERVVKYKEALRGTCTVEDLMQRIKRDAKDIDSVFIDELHPEAKKILDLCRDHKVRCIAGVM